MAYLELTALPRPHDTITAALHDPAARDLLVTFDPWEVRWPPGHPVVM